MNSARIRTICSWLPTLDETRLREVEDFVLAKAIEQQNDSAPARADVSHGIPQAGGGTFSPHGGYAGVIDNPVTPSVACGHGVTTCAICTAPSHPSNGSQRVGGGTFTEAEYAADVAGVVAYAAETGRAVVVRPDGSVRVVISIPTADDAIESGLRELAAATPQVAAPGVADDHTLWSSEMVDGRFDGSDE